MSVEEGRVEEGLMKGTSQEGTGRDMIWTAGVRKRAEEDCTRKGGSKGGKLQGSYAEEGTDQYTVCSQTIPLRGPRH